MPLTTLAALEAARDAARREVHRRALKAGIKAAEPSGIAGAMWGEVVGTLVADIQDIFALTLAQKAELEPVLVRSIGGLIAHYAPAAGRAGTVTELADTLRSSPLARRAVSAVARRGIGRVGLRFGRAGGIGAVAVARRAWIVPAAIGAGTGAVYELIGRRCINQCYAYLRAALALPEEVAKNVAPGR